MHEVISLSISLLAVTAGFSACWLAYLRGGRLAVVDLFWGPGFLLIGAVHAATTGFDLPAALFLTLLAIWAFRLMLHMAGRLRGHSGDDPRYEDMKRAGGDAFRLSSLWKVFWLQAIILFALALPVHAMFLASRLAEPIGILTVAGSLLFVAGFALESVADRQLARFKRSNREPDSLLTTGVWAWSRHPNHFGEAVLWFGLGLYVTSFTGAWWCLLGPAALTAIMIKLSGVAMLDRHLSASKAGFDQYAARTSAFVPWPPKR